MGVPTNVCMGVYFSLYMHKSDVDQRHAYSSINLYLYNENFFTNYYLMCCCFASIYAFYNTMCMLGDCGGKKTGVSSSTWK